MIAGIPAWACMHKRVGIKTFHTNEYISFQENKGTASTSSCAVYSTYKHLHNQYEIMYQSYSNITRDYCECMPLYTAESRIIQGKLKIGQTGVKIG